jgi:hypothetical protein
MHCPSNCAPDWISTNYAPKTDAPTTPCTLLAAIHAQFTQGLDRPELIRASVIIQGPT